MLIIRIKKCLSISLLLLAGQASSMVEMSNDEMETVVGKGLMVTETIAGSGEWSDFSYMRMGLDARVSLNANIDKLQLGCGGFNESIASQACDIDFDFVRLMGRDGNQAGTVGSDFVLTRPYIEIATKGSGTTREIVGFKVGSQSADGYFGIGRTYNNGDTNLENGGVCGEDGDRLPCHSGINSLSGYINAEISGNVPVRVLGGIFSGDGCFGQTNLNSRCVNNAPVFQEIVGTRVNQLVATGLELDIDLGILASLVGIDTAYANLYEDLRFIHGFAFQNTANFGISLQREQIAWPTYDKSDYAEPANAGWWLNVPYVATKDIAGDEVSISGLGDVVSALQEEGVDLTNIELNFEPPKNCFGSANFC
ncbi:hypothetical protein [Alcanivorax sp. NBRC 102024]|uniref:hypothetical protein n=1 Tax=Alcanivorax sp. NBRC 102024 TaxID=1113895 RepID=UPI000789CE3F|nr:hypothetical protein [Alcanivorax sp. NBRC 102024]